MLRGGAYNARASAAQISIMLPIAPAFSRPPTCLLLDTSRSTSTSPSTSAKQSVVFTMEAVDLTDMRINVQPPRQIKINTPMALPVVASVPLGREHHEGTVFARAFLFDYLTNTAAPADRMTGQTMVPNGVELEFVARRTGTNARVFYAFNDLQISAEGTYYIAITWYDSPPEGDTRVMGSITTKRFNVWPFAVEDSDKRKGKRTHFLSPFLCIPPSKMPLLL